MFRLTLLLLLLPVLLHAQPDTLWTRTLNGPENSTLQAVCQWPDGNAAAVGSQPSPPGYDSDARLLMFTLEPRIWFDRSLGGRMGEYPGAVVAASNGDVLMAGSVVDYDAAPHALFLCRYSGYGELLWYRMYAISPVSKGYDMQMVAAPGGGYVLTSTEGTMLIRVNEDGDSLWSHTYSVVYWDMGSDVVALNDGFAALGAVSTSPGYSYLLVRTNLHGDTLWTRMYTCPDMHHNFGQRLCRTADGGFVLGGSVWGDLVSSEVWLVKTNADGDVQWTQTMTGSPYRRINDVTGTQDGGCVVSTYDAGGWLLTKLNSSGNQVWSLPMSGGRWSGSILASVVQSPDGGFLGVGSCYPNGSGQGSMPFMVRTSPDTPEGVSISLSTLPQSIILQNCAPNPFNSSTRIAFDLATTGNVTLKVFDVNGRSVTTLAQGSFSAGPHTILFDGSGLASGMYFYELRAGNFYQTQKMILLR